MKASRRGMVVAATAAIGVLAGATAAYAGGGTGGNGFRASACPGSVIGTYSLQASGGATHPNARVKVYYSTASGGTNCAVLLDNEAGDHYMRVTIGGRPEVPVDWASDYGTFSSYAGAVGIRNTNGRCVHITGTIRDNGRDYDFGRYAWCG
ncbi:hypothetical protein GCM10022415_30170 [Knoellia locipacati]|uniref:Spore-associated protein A n=1 Tax=Knoellia locipacati TaxID=882824 RepID=A0A512T456_9MICO|nr:hypothetical protein [Knoellia locipacati]GEQ14979.1 hypothetical protein KLO01_30260 [Knoellia locipacati]